MLDAAIGLILSLVFPRMETRWLRAVIQVALPATIAIVRELEDRNASNDDKFQLAVDKVAEVLEVAFKAVPEWSELSPAARYRIRMGLVELALFIYRVSGGRNGGKTARQAAKALRRASKE